MKLTAPKRSESGVVSDKSGVLLFNGRSYAVGLLWFTVQDDTAKGLLKQRVKKTDADFYTLRTHISQQQGFGWLKKGHRRGMQAAAAIIADQLVGEWHGVFEADNGWWYVQVRSDTITPNGDRFFTSEEEAYRVFQEEMLTNVWPHAYAPDKWHMNDSNTRELKLTQILDELATATLVPTNITSMFGSLFVRNLALLGLVISVILMITTIIFTMMASSQEETEALQNRRPIRTISNTSAKLATPKIEGVETVSPQQLLQQCGDALADIYQPLPGWKAQQFTCAVGKADFVWQQMTGMLSDAKEIGMKRWPSTVKISFNNRLMTALQPLGNLPKLEPDALVSQEDALLYLEQNLQPLGALQVKPVTPPPPAPVPNADGTMPAVPPPAPLPYLETQLISGYGPDKVSALLMGPGLSLEQVQWNVPQGLWQYKLKWTHQRIAPPSVNNAAQNAAATPNAAASTPAATPTPTPAQQNTTPPANPIGGSSPVSAPASSGVTAGAVDSINKLNSTNAAIVSDQQKDASAPLSSPVPTTAPAQAAPSSEGVQP